MIENKKTVKDDYFEVKDIGYNYIDNEIYKNKSPYQLFDNNISKDNENIFMLGMTRKIDEEADNYFDNVYSDNIYSQIQLENYYMENSMLIIEDAKLYFMEKYNNLLQYSTKLYNNLEERFVVQTIHNFIPAYKSDILN